MKASLPSSAWSFLGASIVLAVALPTPSNPQTTPKPSATPTFSTDIAPILQAKCLPCHGQEGSGPFPLVTFDQVKAKSELVRYQALAKTMPPVTPVSPHGPYANYTPLTDQELVTLQSWIRAGMPAGEGSPVQTQTTPPPTTNQNSLVLSPESPGQTREDGPRYWQVFEIPLPDHPVTINAFDIVPQASKAVRSAIVYVVGPDEDLSIPKETAGSLDLPPNNLLGAWAPGYNSWQLPAGSRRSLPANGKLLVQLQIQPTGKNESADFKISLQNTSQHSIQPRWIRLEKTQFSIPANASPTFELTTTLDQDATFLGALPEARFFASQISLTATLPDQKQLTLFATQQWDPYWIGNYQLQKPISLPQGTVLTARISYSNDDRCAMNENKNPETVTCGPRIEQEICRMNILLASPSVR